jgi:hypothetical protein
VNAEVRVALLALASALPIAACVTGDVPPRPSIVLPCTDGGAPTQLVNAPGCGNLHLAVANATVYWTEEDTGTLKSIPACGGTITTFEQELSSPGPIAVDGKWIFWVNGRKTLMRRPVAAGGSTIFVPATNDTEHFGDENEINALLVHDGTLFFGRYRYALRMPTSGGTPQVIGFSPEDDRGRPGAFALDDTHLYQTEIYHYAISRETLDGSQVGLLKTGVTDRLAPDRIAVSQDFLVLDAIAIADDQVIWAKGNVINAKPVGALEGDAFLSIAAVSTSTRISGFVVSGATNTIYLGAGDAVHTVPLSKAIPFATDTEVPTPTMLATGQPGAGQFAADANNIYWRTSDCRIMRLAK